MTEPPEPPERPGHLDVTGYLLDTLDRHEREQADAHLAECEQCRREVDALRDVEASLGDVPAELFVDGPDDGADMLLARTLSAARGEVGVSHRRRNLLLGAAAVLVLVVGLGAGTVIGSTGNDDTAAPPPATTASPSPGVRTARATDPTTHAGLAVTITPADGWVRVEATITGVPAGNRCRLVVVGRGGARETAGGWAVSATAARSGLTVSGAALITPTDLAAVQVVSITGRTLVTVPL